MLHLSADAWSAFFFQHANVLHSPTNVTQFPDSMSFGHMDDHARSHTQTLVQKHSLAHAGAHIDDKRGEKEKSGKTELWPVGSVPFEEFILLRLDIPGW